MARLRDDDVLRIVLGYDLPAHRRRRAVLNDLIDVCCTTKAIPFSCLHLVAAFRAVC